MNGYSLQKAEQYDKAMPRVHDQVTEIKITSKIICPTTLSGARPEGHTSSL